MARNQRPYVASIGFGSKVDREQFHKKRPGPLVGWHQMFLNIRLSRAQHHHGGAFFSSLFPSTSLVSSIPSPVLNFNPSPRLFVLSLHVYFEASLLLIPWFVRKHRKCRPWPQHHPGPHLLSFPKLQLGHCHHGPHQPASSVGQFSALGLLVGDLVG
jgi:hypothetical protein